jgi:hypothetical protein
MELTSTVHNTYGVLMMVPQSVCTAEIVTAPGCGRTTSATKHNHLVMYILLPISAKQLLLHHLHSTSFSSGLCRTVLCTHTAASSTLHKPALPIDKLGVLTLHR